MTDPLQGALVQGEIRYGRYGFSCSNSRRHIFHHMFPDGSGTGMDIGPCEGESCALARTHGLVECQGCESGSCLKSRRITIDHMRRNHGTHIHPMGKGRSRHVGRITITGGFVPDWYSRLAYGAETLDRLTSDWPDDWQRRECEANELGHNWTHRDDSGRDPCQAANGSSHMHRDGDEPDHIANAAQRRCTHCPTAQTKRANGEWTDSRDDCPCCAEFPSDHSQYYCIVCGHEPMTAKIHAS
jgi:hypothetical protein